MQKTFRTKISQFFFCLLFFSLASCATNAPPPPEEDPLYQALNPKSDSSTAASTASQSPSSSPMLMPAIPGMPGTSMPEIPETVPQNPPIPNIPDTTTTTESKNPSYFDPYSNVASSKPSNEMMIPNPQPIFITPTSLAYAPKNIQTPAKDFSNADCDIDEDDIKEILAEVKKRRSEVIRTMPNCLKLNRSLMMRAAIIDPPEFEFAADILKEDESFVRRMIEINPEILKFAAVSLRSEPDFMEEATYLNRDALQYADSKLLNNKIFMRKMIEIDAKNYIFASDRLKELPEFATTAFKDDGTLLKYAPQKVKEDKKLVTTAIMSNSDALQYASEALQQDRSLKKLAEQKTSINSVDDLKKFLRENYVNDSDKKNVGFIIDNRMKFFGDYAMVDRNYVTKWQRSFETRNSDNFRLIAADSRNFPVSWHDDFKRFPLLIKKIEKFFRNHQVDQSTIDNLSTVYFWKVKKKPQTVVFNLYLLRDSKDAELGPRFSDITSLTAIAQKRNEEWHLSVVEVIFDSEMKIDLAYENGHKKYILWDLYEVDKKDKNPKLIFKVEDKFSEYFEIFEEQNNGKYRMVQRVDSLKDANEEDSKPAEKSKNDEDSF